MPILRRSDIEAIARRIRNDRVFCRTIETVGITTPEDVQRTMNRLIAHGKWDLRKPRGIRTIERIHETILSL